MKLTRRLLLKAAAVLPTIPHLSANGTPLRIGVTDWNLDLAADPAAVAKAAQLGFQGVQISLGRKIVDGKLPLDNPDLIARAGVFDQALARHFAYTAHTAVAD